MRGGYDFDSVKFFVSYINIKFIIESYFRNGVFNNRKYTAMLLV
jgi:hypothetical protein